MHDPQKEARDRLIDAARADVVFLAERQTGLAEALNRLDRQSYGDAERLQAAAEQLRARFSGAEAIPLLETAHATSTITPIRNRRPAPPRSRRTAATAPRTRPTSAHSTRSTAPTCPRAIDDVVQTGRSGTSIPPD